VLNATGENGSEQQQGENKNANSSKQGFKQRSRAHKQIGSRRTALQVLQVRRRSKESFTLQSRERFLETNKKITTLTVTWARQLVSPQAQPKLGPVPYVRPREPAPMSSIDAVGGLAERLTSERERWRSLYFMVVM
jgi:hypothetical protein